MDAFIFDNEKTSCPTNSSGRVSNKNIHRVRSCSKFNGCAARHGVGLGPFQFTAYDNDLPLATIIACLYLFVDDTTAVIKGETSQDRLTLKQ
jgi:hypothetical protein